MSIGRAFIVVGLVLTLLVALAIGGGALEIGLRIFSGISKIWRESSGTQMTDLRLRFR